ncbi:nucleotide sugar dehydrogenase [Haloglomus litoreum]|uniref:nucleotide sugar dehydrogenase n=1 Tax=Haloglomus litoreum TaxID=3034026 RepID=UPI0023E81DDF|nr:nucleotide sugar dehydrogenase [Haloglomus sp. DT116]
MSSLFREGPSDSTRDDRLATGEVPVAVYGLGKMGLPLAAALADATGNVTGVDVDESVVEAVNAGDCPVGNEPGLPALVAETVADGSLTATTEGEAAAAAAAVHVIIVPTTLHEDGVPDLSTLRAVLGTVGAGLSPDDLVLVESTVPPRTCEDVVVPLLSQASGLAPDAFGVAFCPERTASGRALTDIRGAYPKVVGGVDPASTRAAARLYEHLTDNEVVTVADATTAEAVKVFEGIYRDVNIALANELARFADDLAIDTREAIEVANTQPYCDLHDPGIGVGGHCIPYYPEFLASTFGREAPLIRTARDVNDGMPLLAVRELGAALAERGIPLAGADILLLGLAYRPGVAETRKSPARPVAERLVDLGASVSAVDPVLEDADGFPVDLLPLGAVGEGSFDGVVLVTAHEAFDDIDWTAVGDTVVVDGRGVLDADRIPGPLRTIGDGRAR